MGAQNDNDIPNIPYKGTVEQFDAFQADLKDRLEKHLKGKKITEQLILDAQALLTEGLMVEVAEGRIELGTLEVVLGLDEENRRLVFGFRPPDPDEPLGPEKLLEGDEDVEVEDADDLCIPRGGEN